MSNKSLDILEEQFFNILKEYVPQTGRGFSDGNEHVGKKTKGPYEYVAEEDTPWYKKKYKEDSKNLKILIGHGSKTPKYAKKGGPFTQDPPKRRPVNKLSAPPMALDEEALPQSFKDAFLKLTNAEVSFKALKDINAKVAVIGDVLVFKQGKTYQGIIRGNDISLKATEKGDQALTKQEFLGKLEQAQGELCQSVDCNVSTIKSNGKTLTFNQFIEQVNQPQPTEEPKVPTVIQKTQEQDGQQNAAIAAGVTAKVASGASVEGAIKQEMGYNEATKEFSKAFYEVMEKGLQKIKDPDEKKAAALTSVLFNNIAIIPIDFVVTISNAIPSSVFTGIKGSIEEFLKSMFPEIQQLKELYEKAKKTVKKIEDAADKIIDLKKAFSFTKLIDLPTAENNVNTVVVIGDKQANSLTEAFTPFFNSKGYNKIGQTFSLAENSEFIEITNKEEIVNYIKTNSNNIGIIFISLGTLKPQVAVQFDQVVTELKNIAPKSKIVWIGSPPLQKGADKQTAYNVAIGTINSGIKAGSITQGKEFIYIDPTEYLTDNEGAGVYLDSTTLSPVGAKKILDGALTGKKKEEGGNNKPQTDDSVPMLPTEYIEGLAGVAKFKLLNEDLQKELIKLSKKAKQVFGDKAKIHIQSGQRKDSKNHAPGQAADIRISVDGNNRSAQETYAFIISSIVDGTIKDGGVGYYANDKGIYDPKNMDVTSEYPHYDVRGVRKWFWFNCESDLDKCKGRVNAPKYFKPMEDHYQTSGDLTAAQVADSSNPLSLPEDVFKLIGTYYSKKKEQPEQKTEQNKAALQATATKLNDLPNAIGTRNKIVIAGNSQSSAFSEGLRSFLKGKGYTYDTPNRDIYYYTIGDSNPEDLITAKGKTPSIQDYLKANKDKVAGVLIVTGLNARSESWYETAAKKLVNYIREGMPDAQIIWVGSPVIQKTRNDYQLSNEQRRANNQGVRKASESDNFIFINPFNHMTDNSYSGGDGLHLPNSIAKKVIEGAISGTTEAPKKLKYSEIEQESVKLIKTRFTEAGLSKKLAYAAIVNSWHESGWIPNLEGDKAKKLAEWNKCAQKVLEQEGERANCGGGLFGIHSCGGRGGCRATNSNAMSLADIKDPEKSIAKIISHIKNDSMTGNILKKSAEEGVTVEDLVEHFCYHVENPKNKATRCKERRSTTDSILKKAGITDYNA